MCKAMEAEFINSFEITEEIFVTWAKNPVNRLAKPLKYLLWAFELLVLAGICWYGIRSGKLLMALFMAAAVFFMNVRGLLTAGPDAKKRWAEMKKALGDEAWLRETQFTEKKVTVTDNGAATTFSYGSLKSITEQGEFAVLVFDKQALRLKKDAFVQGDWEGLRAFLKEKTGI